MRPRIPLTYASLLIVALVAVVGFAAFSPSPNTSANETGAPTTLLAAAPPASARIASAVLAVRVMDTELQAATNIEPNTNIQQVPAAAPEEPTMTAQGTATTTTTQPSDTTPPPIRITSHSDGESVTNSLVTFSGTTEPGADVRSGPFDANVNENGEWFITLVVADGANLAVFTAIDTAGNISFVRITVHYDEPTPTTTTTHAHSQTTTTQPAVQARWSPLWPADPAGTRDVEVWRSLVEKYWGDKTHWNENIVDCVLGIIYMESRGDPRAYLATYSTNGLMQHKATFWKARAGASGFIDANGLYATPWNAEANIAAGAFAAKESVERYENTWFQPWSKYPAYGSCPASSSTSG